MPVSLTRTRQWVCSLFVLVLKYSDKLLSDEPPKSTCPFTFYAQIHPVQVPGYLMQELEEEIQKPTGIWTISPPKLSISALLISKECGIMYEVVETEGLRYVVL